MPSNTLTEEEKQLLSESLKRCPKGTFESAVEYRKTKDVSLISKIVFGIIERFLEPDMRVKIHEPGSSELRLFDDLGVDSLTMVEIVMLVEETLQMSIDNEDLRDLRTLNDITHYIECSLQGIKIAKNSKHIPITEIVQCMPHQQPFLFIQDAILEKENAYGTYQISGQEFFLEGHFKNNPVFPASIMLEALGQLAVLYILKTDNINFKGIRNPNSIYFTSSNGVRVQRICKPGDMLKLAVRLKKIRHPLSLFEGTIKVKGQKVVFVEEIGLAFDYLQKEENSNLQKETIIES